MIYFKNPPALSFPICLNYTDDGTIYVIIFTINSSFCIVPIYDLRQNVDFAFRADDLINLTRLPLCERDLPPETLATVGYTVNSYPYRAANASWQGYTVITLNILFVLALGHIDHAKLIALNEKM